MLGVGGAAAVAGDQELVAVAKCARDRLGDLSGGVEQGLVGARALKRLA